MNKKDIQIIKDSADAIISNTPVFGIAWGLSKALFGAGMKLRQERVIEWAEMIKDNPGVFAKEILETNQFQDGFVFALEKYIRERSEVKRKIMKNIFLSFTEAEKKGNFEIERMYHTLSILNYDDLMILKDVDIEQEDFHQIYKNTTEKNENIYNLISAGILTSDYSSRLGPIRAPFVKITRFGKDFINYLEK